LVLPPPIYINQLIMAFRALFASLLNMLNCIYGSGFSLYETVKSFFRIKMSFFIQKCLST
jgi:hypothetical protein